MKTSEAKKIWNTPKTDIVGTRFVSERIKKVSFKVGDKFSFLTVLHKYPDSNTILLGASVVTLESD